MTQTAPETCTLAGTPTADDHVIVLFGSTGEGDLARRKLLPGLFHLHEAGLLPANYRIIGRSRKRISDDEFRARTRAAIDSFGRKTLTEETWEAFAASLHYAPSDASDASELGRAVATAK